MARTGGDGALATSGGGTARTSAGALDGTSSAIAAGDSGRSAAGNHAGASSDAGASGAARGDLRAAPRELADLSEPARRLLAAADELFFRQGAVATTVREITAACGLTPGALYNHFSSKEELLHWLVMYRHRLLETALDDALATCPDDPECRLRTVVEVYVAVHQQQHARRGARVANREYRGLTGPRLAEVVAIRRRLRDRVVAIVHDGSERGVFHVCGGSGRASVTLAAATILDMCVNAAEWLRPDGQLPFPELQERYVAMALRLVGAQSA